MFNKKYFILTNSNAAPFFSDSDEYYVCGKTAMDALKSAVKKYNHPCGLYAASLYKNADDYHTKKKPLATWLCNKEALKEKVTKNKGCFSYLGISKDKFEIDGKLYIVKDPDGGEFKKIK